MNYETTGMIKNYATDPAPAQLTFIDPLKAAAAGNNELMHRLESLANRLVGMLPPTSTAAGNASGGSKLTPVSSSVFDQVSDLGRQINGDLSSAFDAGETEAPGGEVAAPELEAAEPLEGETQEQADQRARDAATGQFTKAPKKPAAKPAVTTKPTVKPTTAVKSAVVKPGVVAPGAKPVVSPAAVPGEMKAPQAWRGPAKETWAQLPEAARVEVLRREKEIATQLQGVGEDRKYAGTMRQAFQPFEAQIRAEGSTPEAAIGKLMNTAMLLRTGPPHLKAHAIADMITTYGIPLEPLVAALQGKPPPADQQHQPQHVDPASIAQQVEQALMKRLGSQRDTQLLAKSEAEVATFLEKQPMHGLDGVDHGEDIRETMADLIDVAAKRGLKMTLESAYTLAARAHPEVSKVLERHEAAAKATKANASTSRARVASSSVRNSPTTQPVGKTGGSLRDHLNAAVEQHE